MNTRPFESSAKPTGLKHRSGHFELSAFVMMSVREVRLSEAATGEPEAKAMVESL
jgi:hypothetical protein